MSDQGLETIAATARDALSCDAIVITQRTRSGRTTIAATAGVDPRRTRGLRATMEKVEAVAEHATGGHAWHVPLEFRDGEFDPQVCQLLQLDHVVLGGMHLLGSHDAGVDDVPLFEAFCANATVALHRRGRRGEAPNRQETEPLPFDSIAATASGIGELIPHIETELSYTLGKVRVGVAVFEEDGADLQLLAGSFGVSSRAVASSRVNPRNLRSNAARVFELQHSYMTNHAVGDPAILQDYIVAFGIRRLLSIPLVAGSRRVGVLHVADKASDFTVADVHYCERIAPRVISAVELARLVMSLRRQHEIESALSEAAVALARGGNTSEFLPGVQDQLRRATDALLVAVVPADGREPLVARGALATRLEREALEQAVRATTTRNRVVLPRHAGDPGFAVYGAPVVLAGRRISTVLALRRRAQAFARDERRGFARLANMVALAWATERIQHQRTMMVRLEERQRIADDLHDDVAQILFAAQMRLDAVLVMDGLDPEVNEHVLHARGLLVRGDATTRDAIRQLSSPPTNSVADQVVEVAGIIEDEFNIEIDVTIDGQVIAAVENLAPEVAEILVKVAREALVNVAKHAGPCEAEIMLELVRGRVRLRVTDNGVGVCGSVVEHHGLTSLRRLARKHGGALSIGKRSAGGTRVTISVPAPDNDADFPR